MAANIVRNELLFENDNNYHGIERVRRDYDNPIEAYEDADLRKWFRMGRETLYFVLNIVSGDLTRPTHRSNALPPVYQLLGALRYLASNSFQVDVANNKILELSQASISRSVTTVTAALARVAQDYIFLPSTQADVQRMQGLFFDNTGMPGIVGIIDGTQIQIQAPAVDEDVFVNRNNYHSLNVQVVTNFKDQLINIVGRWPGSTHDSTILLNSSVTPWFSRPQVNFHPGAILGDSGYGCKRWIWTPIRNPTSPAEDRYNRYVQYQY